MNRAKSGETCILVYFGTEDVRDAKLKTLVDGGRLIAFRATDTAGTGLDDDASKTDEKLRDTLTFKSSVFETNLYDLMKTLGAKKGEYRLFDWTGNELAKATNPTTIAGKVGEAAKLREKLEEKADKMLTNAKKASDAKDYAKAKKELEKMAKAGYVGFKAVDKARELADSLNNEVASKD